jgi:membrane associated rhomboid family serine protease
MPNFAVYMETKKSIFQRASEWGVPFGLYLTCGAMAFIFADWFAPLGLIFIVLFFATPIVVYYFQRRKFIEDDGFTDYSALWMLGIMLFILGTVLASFIVYLVLQFGRPNFMYDQAAQVIKAYSEMPDMKDSELLVILQRMVDQRRLPSPIEVVFNAFWFITFGGSVTSAITALIAKRKLKKYRRQ